MANGSDYGQGNLWWLKNPPTNYRGTPGANHREAQSLARHSTPELTANIYGRTRNERLVEVTDRVADRVLLGEVGVNMVHKTEQDVTNDNDKSLHTKALTLQNEKWRRGDSNPRPVTFQAKRLHV